MESKETMGKRISDLRKKKGMTQEQLAQRVGVTAQAVSKWENDLSCPDISILSELSEALGVTTDELLGRAPLKTVSDSTDDNTGKVRAPFRITVRMNKVERVAFALLLMGIGVIFLLHAFHVIQLGEGITFWSVLWPFLVACIGVMACKDELNPISIGLVILGLYMLLFNLGIIPAQYKLTWSMVWPAALILIGITILIHFIWPHRKHGSVFEVEKSDPVFECVEEGGFITIEAAFSSQTKRVESGEPFTGASIDASFGNYVLDLTQADIQDGAIIHADISFGNLTIQVPSTVGVRAACESSFGSYDCPPGDPDALVKINLKGEVSFGKIEVEYR